MHKPSLLFCLFFGLSFQIVFSQTQTNIRVLKAIEADQQKKLKDRKIQAVEFARENNLPIREETNESVIEIQYFDSRGHPQYFKTTNAISAESISTDEVYSGGSAGLDLDGSGIEVHQWDAGSVRSTHQELENRVTNSDPVGTSWHSTHVGGTIIASGVQSNAKGMAWAASLKAFDWNDFHAEIAAEAAAGALISNHSYGWLRGWEGGNTWWGDPEISDQEDYLFGFYDESAATWDSIVYAAPYFLIVKSAGNDRDDKGDGTYPDDGPYDCIDQLGIAKNNLVVAAVYDVPGGYTQASDVTMSGFSSWGPADDGRIKPDISANGVGLISTDDDADDDYRNSSGTSMSTPSVAGSVALLQQHYQDLNGSGNFMTAATVKALLIHTADETGNNPGPDYAFGWGLMNTKNAALKISENQSREVIIEGVLNEGENIIIGFTNSDTTEIKATLAWTDPPGIPPAPSLDPPDTLLVNDLDLQMIDFNNGTIFYPWKLDKDNPSFAATNSTENDVDNVEMVLIEEPLSETSYSLIVDHDGNLQSGSQAFSLVLSFDGEVIEQPVTDFSTDKPTPIVTDTVHFTDQTANSPQKWEWSFSPDYVTFLNGSDSSSQHPQVQFDSTGTYNVSLTTWNAGGTSNETKLDFITTYDMLEVETMANPESLCEGDSCQLTASAEGGSGDYDFSWYSFPEGFASNEQNPIITPDQSATYIVEVEDGIQSSSDSVFVEVYPLPVIQLGDWPEQLCNEDEPPVLLTAIPEGGTYSGENVTPEGIFTPEEAAVGWNVITYTYQDEHDCVNSAVDSILINDCVGLSTNAKDTDIKIFPNPGNGEFIIESAYILEKVELFDQYGILRYAAQPYSGKLKVSGLWESGLYLIRINFTNGNSRNMTHKKVIIR